MASRFRLRVLVGVALAIATLGACSPSASPSPSAVATAPAVSPTAPATDEVTHDVIVGSTCADATKQLCSPAATVTTWTEGGLRVVFTASTGHCSPVIVHLSLDGESRYTSGQLGPGQGTGPQDFGPVSPGPHLVAVQGEGVVGGCNSGGVANWGGTLTLTVAALPGAYPTPRLELPAP